MILDASPNRYPAPTVGTCPGPYEIRGPAPYEIPRNYA